MKDEQYEIRTFCSPTEVLKIFGKEALTTVFPDAEVLCFRNLCKEGISLENAEWDFLASVLKWY
jgi:hypothetical protein